MKFRIIRYFLTFCAIIFGHYSYSQLLNVDSCLNVLKTAKEDTNKVILNIVSMLDKDVGDFIENMNSLLKTDNKDTESVAKEAALYASIIRLVNRMLIDVECIRKQ